MASNNERETAAQKVRREAEAVDARRQRQIKQQSVRMDAMKEIILSMAGELRDYEKLLADKGVDLEYGVRSVDQIIKDHS